MNYKPNIKLELTEHNQTQVIKILFDYNNYINNQLRKTTLAKWSQSMKCWQMPRADFNLGLFFNNFSELAWIDYSGLKENQVNITPKTLKNQQIIDEIKSRILREETQFQIHQFREWMQQKRYSPNTIKTYSEAINSFFKILSSEISFGNNQCRLNRLQP